jgi:hypothetical protein
VEIATKPTFQASPPKPVFPSPPGVLTGTVAADGKRALLGVPVGQGGPPQFTVVENWPAALKKPGQP